MTRPPDDAQVAAIAGRLRDFVFRQPGFQPPQLAEKLGVSERELNGVLSPEGALANPLALIGLIPEVARHYGVDANWILTGEYDPIAHRTLDEEDASSPSGVRGLVAERLSSRSAPRPAIKFPT